MDVTVRPARHGDLEPVAAFTRDTFTWGDYIEDRFLGWLEDESGLVMVATGEDDVPIGVGRVVLLSPREAWLHAARVHPDHRRKGVGARLNLYGCDWAAAHGAVVARLLVEDWNEPAVNQVLKLGYRRAAPWVWARRDLASGEIDPKANGGRRVPGEERLTPGTSAETDPAWIAWSSGELANVGRQLFPIGWDFRRMTTEDVADAARRRALWHCPSGWVIADLDEEAEELVVSWVVTNDLDVSRLVHALLDRGEATSAERLRLWVPKVSWMTEALEAAGFEMSPAWVFARTLA